MSRPSPGLFWLAAALALMALGACRQAQEPWAWPSDTAALVEGRPITMTELNQVLGWGLYGQLDQDRLDDDQLEEGRLDEEEGESDPDAVPLMVLEKMIEERLVLAEAARFKFSVKEAEKEMSAASLDEVLSGLPPAQAEALRLGLLRQLAAHRITSMIMARERRFSSADWQAFWRAWPKNKHTRYLVRVLFLPPSTGAPHIPKSENLDQLAQNFKLAGFPAILSETVWLQSDRLGGDLREVLENAWASQLPSPPIRQEDSWAVYEVLDLDRETAAVTEFKAARIAYELKIGEEGFRRWLAARRLTADIRINPNLFQTRE